MLSYRDQLSKIGIAHDANVAYGNFYSKNKSLKAAMRSMDAPETQDWQQVSDTFRNDYWTDEVQGVAWNGSHWIFSTNANQDKPGAEDKAIYVFKGGHTIGDGDWSARIKYKDVPHPIAGTVESDCHWGQLTYYKGFIYVSHFWSAGPRAGRTNVVVFRSDGPNLTYKGWIELNRPTSPTTGRKDNAEFQGINPWDGMFYTCFGSDEIHEFFKHDPLTGEFTGETLALQVPVRKVQGACFSNNGHLYIASNVTLQTDDNYQTIWYYSVLNGHLFGVIPVLAEEGLPDQELEGICYANVSTSEGKKAQIHAILLENPLIALDNIFFKSFASARPEIV